MKKYIPLYQNEEYGIIILLLLSILLSTVSPWIITIGSIVLYIYLNMRCSYKSIGLTLLLLCLSVFSYIFFGLFNGNVTIQIMLYFGITSVLCFCIGNGLVQKFKSENNIFFIFTVIIISMALPHIYITIIDIFNVGLVNPERILSVYGDESQRSICQRTVELSLCIGSMAFLFLTPSNYFQSRVIRMVVTFAILGELCTLHYVSRTGIAFMLMAIFLGLIFKWGVSFKTIGLFIVLLLTFTYLKNTELFSVFSERETDYSNVGNVGQRLPRWEWGLNEIANNQWGSVTYKNAQHSFAHNFWIDWGKISGVIPFILLITLSIRNLYQVSKVFFRKYRTLSFVILVLTVIFYMALFTEPIHEGAPLFMFIYFMYCGIVDRIERYGMYTS